MLLCSQPFGCIRGLDDGLSGARLLWSPHTKIVQGVNCCSDPWDVSISFLYYETFGVCMRREYGEKMTARIGGRKGLSPLPFPTQPRLLVRFEKSVAGLLSKVPKAELQTSCLLLLLSQWVWRDWNGCESIDWFFLLVFLLGCRLPSFLGRCCFSVDYSVFTYQERYAGKSA